MVTVSVIICTYNRADTLKKTLDSLMSQKSLEEGNSWELLIIDNNSNDNTREVVESFIARFELNLHYIFEPRQGKSYALNTGIANSKGHVLTFTDDDVIVDSKWVGSILDASKEYPHNGFGGKVLPLWPGPIPGWIQPSGPYSRPIIGGPIPSHDRGNEVKEYEKGMWVPIGGNMFFRKEVFDKYGGFRTDLGPRGNIYGSNEDSEFCFRLMKKGEKLLYYPKAVIYHPVAQYKISKKYIQNYFWEAGLTQARIEDFPPKVTRYFRVVPSQTLRLLKKFGIYLLSAANDQPSAAFHHKCMLYSFSARLYLYIIKKD